MNYQKFVELLSEAEIVDTRYPLRGTYIWPPYGFELKERIFSMISKVLSKNDYQRFQFPRLIPREAIEPITKNIQDFEYGMFWLYSKKKGEKEFYDVFLNPTSDSSVNLMLPIWIRDGKKLPIRIFQIGSIFRPHKYPHPLINPNESTNLMEAYAVHSSKEEALDDIRDIIKIYGEIYNKLGIPYKVLDRPLRGNKPVAEQVYSFVTYLPFMNRSFNVGTIYYQGQIFSKFFGTKVGKNENATYAYQITFGISERCIAAMLALHSDQYGLRILPQFAPIQVALTPLEKNEKILQYTENVKKRLSGLRFITDEKYNKSLRRRLKRYSMMGIPIRLTITNRNVENESVTISKRDREEVENITLPELRNEIERSFPEIYDSLYKRAKSRLEERLIKIESLLDLSHTSKQSNIGIFRWCNNESCGVDIENKIEGEILGYSLDEVPQGTCINCGNEAKVIAYFGKRTPSP